MNDYIEVRIITGDQTQKDLLSALLAGMGFEGFEEEKNALLGYVPQKDFDETAFREFAEAIGIEWSVKVIEERNWNEDWEKTFQPVVLGDFCQIRAAFHPSVSGILHDIIITPKMSFGTGHHATTSMMVQSMKEIDFKGRTVLDFGTGTGILGILASKSGAKMVTGIDNDSWSIENANENIISNNCDNVVIINKNSLDGLGKFDIILANINRNLILAELKSIKQHLEDDGVLMLSGLLETDKDVVMKEAKSRNLQLAGEIKSGGWICLRMMHA